MNIRIKYKFVTSFTSMIGKSIATLDMSPLVVLKGFFGFCSRSGYNIIIVNII